MGAAMKRMPMPGQRLTPRQILHRLDITPLTLLNWRRGSRDRAPLPVRYSSHGKARRVWIAEEDLENYLAHYRPDLLAIWHKR